MSIFTIIAICIIAWYFIGMIGTIILIKIDLDEKLNSGHILGILITSLAGLIVLIVSVQYVIEKRGLKSRYRKKISKNI